MNAYEVAVADEIANTAAYEGATATGLGLSYANWAAYDAAAGGLGINAGPAKWGDATANPITDILNWKRAVSNHIGIRPNSAVIGSAVFDRLLTTEAILDRIQFTTSDSIDVDVIARYFGLERGIRVAEGRKLDEKTAALEHVFPENAVLLFYSPLSASDSVMPAGGAVTVAATTPIVRQQVVIGGVNMVLVSFN